MKWKKGYGILSGIEKDLNSYRGELGPLEGLVNCIEILSPVLGQTSASLVAASDNDSDMTYLDLQKHQLNTRYTSLVLLSSLFGVESNLLPFQPKPPCVKAQEDSLHRQLKFLQNLNQGK